VAKQSAGIVLYRIEQDNLEVFLVHPGGPFWTKKDLGAWSIPKGEFEAEDALVAAKRELLEETGLMIEGELVTLAPQKQKSGKVVYAWAVEGNINPGDIKSNTFELEWPPKSGKKQLFPEIDKANWFPIHIALQKINQGQTAFLQELALKLDKDIDNDDTGHFGEHDKCP
jgi:predicted NUDIX family NTP pyrophosphohydrolase